SHLLEDVSIALLALPQRLLRLASVVNVDADAHPSNDPPVGVADRHATTKLPAVLPVRPAQRGLADPLAARCEGLPPQVHGPVAVFRADAPPPTEPFALRPRGPRLVIPPSAPPN